MRAVIQRVHNASVAVGRERVAAIEKGLVILVGVEKKDTAQAAQNLAKKILELRIFNDRQKKMNLSVQDARAEILVVSQFTLCADLSKGRRPSFAAAAEPQTAEKLYLDFVRFLKDSRLKVEQGIFKEYMTVNIANDGPVTFILDSQ